MEHAYTPAQVCKKFNISKSTLLRWEADGRIPAPHRNLRGERRYTNEHYQAIARFVQLRQHGKRYAQIVAEDVQNAQPELERFGERNALFKFVNLRDLTGLIELREYSMLQPSTIRQLLRVAADEYSPDEDRFWDIIDVICETSRPKERVILKP